MSIEALGLIRIGTSHRSSTKIQLPPHKTNSVQDRPGPGRPTVTNPRQDQHVTLMHARNIFLTAASTVGRIEHKNL